MIGKRKPPARFDRPQAFDNESTLGSATTSFPPLGYSMSSPAVSIAHVRKSLHRFRRNRRGSAAVEFALVAPLFFALLFAIIETAIVFFASQVLETVAQDTGRLILTGQAQNAGYKSEADLKAAVCATGNAVNVLFSNCTDTTNGLFIDVQNYPGFSNVVLNSQIDASGNFINNMKYCPGNAGDIVVVRVFYKWQLFVTGLGYNISNLTGSQRLLSATAAFRNEPFIANPAPCQ
jgi:Flp pilus assembly protein TadG